jgi:hypothetical protein
VIGGGVVAATVTLCRRRDAGAPLTIDRTSAMRRQFAKDPFQNIEIDGLYQMLVKACRTRTRSIRLLAVSGHRAETETIDAGHFL